MPSWAAWLVKTLVEWAWGKVYPALIKLFKRKQVDKEVDKEQVKINDAKKLAAQWIKKNPGKPLPKDIEDRLRDSASDRARGL